MQEEGRGQKESVLKGKGGEGGVICVGYWSHREGVFPWWFNWGSPGGGRGRWFRTKSYDEGSVHAVGHSFRGIGEMHWGKGLLFS